MSKILIIIFLIISFVYSSDYERTYKCRSSHEKDLNYEIFTNPDIIDIHWIDAFYFIIMGPIAFLITLSFLLLFFIFPELLKNSPGDILFGTVFAEFLLTIHWLTSSIMFFHLKRKGEESPKSESIFCQTNGFISIFAGTLEMLYNISFCVFLVQKIRTFLNPQDISKFYFHLFSIGISALFSLFIFYIGDLGKSLFGTCSFSSDSRMPFFGPVVLIFYWIFAIFTIFYFKIRVANHGGQNNFLNYYYKYVLISTLIWISIVTANIVAICNCLWFQKPWIDIALTIGNINKLNTPIALTLVRTQDPFIKPKLIELYYLFKERCKKKKIKTEVFLENNDKIINKMSDVKEIISEENDNLESINRQFSNPEDEFNRRRCQSSYTKSHSDVPREQSDVISDHNQVWINELTETLKTTYINVMILSVLKHVKDLNEFKKDLELSNNFLSKNRIFQLKCKDLQKEFNESYYLLENCQDLEVKIKALNSFSFNQILINDEINLFFSLDIIFNQEQIKNASKNDGGRGGQFFFFSFDDKIIIKSLSNDDWECLEKLAYNYCDYLNRNKESLIVKIYGVFEFEFIRKSKQKKAVIFNQKILIMRNLAACNKMFIQKTYDLKGSTFQRESLKKNKNNKKIVLKDIDFLKIEKQIYLNEENQRKLIYNIIQDANFFRNNGIIDYSLLVLIINYKHIIELGEDKEYEKMRKNVFSSVSNINNNIIYQIGIIDFLQVYNYKKMIEKYGKKILKANIELDTSSQNPIDYAKRFCNFMEKIIIPKEEL